MATKKQLAARKRWVKALRSGKYQQGQSYLCTDNGWEGQYGDPRYCCLGVSAEIEGLPAKFHLSNGDEGQWFFDYPGDGTQDAMPDNQWFNKTYGFEANSSSYRNGIAGKLADMNDEGRSFDEIADFIESLA
jgi:hypothetical protein